MNHWPQNLLQDPDPALGVQRSALSVYYLCAFALPSHSIRVLYTLLSASSVILSLLQLVDVDSSLRLERTHVMTF